MEASREVIAQSEVESEVESTEGDEEKLQEGHNQEAKEAICWKYGYNRDDVDDQGCH